MYHNDCEAIQNSIDRTLQAARQSILSLLLSGEVLVEVELLNFRTILRGVYAAFRWEIIYSFRSGALLPLRSWVKACYVPCLK